MGTTNETTKTQNNFNFDSLSSVKSKDKKTATNNAQPTTVSENKKTNISPNTNDAITALRSLTQEYEKKEAEDDVKIQKRRKSAERIDGINTALNSVGNFINLFSGAPGYKMPNLYDKSRKELDGQEASLKDKRDSKLERDTEIVESMSNTQKLREERLHQLSRDAKLNHYNSNLLKEKFGLSGAEQSKKLESQNMISERATELAYAELGGKTKQNEASNSLKSDKLTEDTRSSKANEDIKTQKLKIDSVKAEDSFKGGFYGHNRSAIPNQNGKVIGIAKTKSEKNPNNIYKTID